MTIFTYARVSTLDQDAGYQMEALQKAYPAAVHRQEKGSGTTTQGRDILNLLLDMMGHGDKLVCWKLDRLAHQKIDTATATGRAFLQMLGVFAEFETNLRKERQLAGIAQAKAKGKHLGRKASLTDEQKKYIRQLHQGGMNPTALAKRYEVSRATIYNAVKEG